MKTKLLALGLLAALPLSANADLLSVEIATGNWDREISGDFQAGITGDNLSLDGTGTNGLGMEDEKDGYTFVEIRHFVPLVPNVKFTSTSLSHSGSNDTVNFNFDGQTYASAINTELDLDHTDITAFWNLLDTGVRFDLGLTARQLDGEISVDDGSTKTTTKVDGTVPMLYAGVAISPISNLRFSYEVNYIGSGENALTDTIAKVSYHTDFMLGIEVGVRDMSLELDDSDGNFADMDFSGSFVGVSLKF